MTDLLELSGMEGNFRGTQPTPNGRKQTTMEENAFRSNLPPDRTSSPNPVFVHPNISLYGTNSEGNKISGVLSPEDYLPLRTNLPDEIPGLDRRMNNSDQEVAAEIHLKISLDELTEQRGTIPRENLVRHLQEFPFSSRAITRESLRRLQAGVGLFDQEHNSPLIEFAKITKNQPKYDYLNQSKEMDEFLMGGFDWKGVPTHVLRVPIQRFFYWILNTTPID